MRRVDKVKITRKNANKKCDLDPALFEDGDHEITI